MLIIFQLLVLDSRRKAVQLWPTIFASSPLLAWDNTCPNRSFARWGPLPLCFWDGQLRNWCIPTWGLGCCWEWFDCIVRKIPAELSVEGVGSNCSHCVLGVEEVNWMRCLLSPCQFTLYFLLQEQIKGKIFSRLLSSQYFSIYFFRNISDSIWGTFWVDDNAVTFQPHSLRNISKQTVSSIEIVLKLWNKTYICVASSSYCIHCQKTWISAWDFYENYMLRKIP